MRAAIIAAATLAMLLGAARPGFAQTLELDRAVILMRHGVRPPTNTHEIAPLAAQPWPAWSVADGQLTPHGAEAVGRLGAWERQHFAGAGLLSASGCPRPGEFFLWSDGSQKRTVDTANAFVGGLYPGCGLRTGTLPGGKADPLFKASETEVGRLDIAEAKRAIMERMGGSFDRPKAEAASLLAQVQEVIRCCDRRLCEERAGTQACGLADLPWWIETVAEGRSIDLRGPLGQGSSIVQVLLLQYIEGKPAEELGWGRTATAADIVRLSALRKLKYEYQERVPYIARRGASNIANQIMLAMNQPEGDAPNGPPAARLVVFVGNDTQIAEVGALLDMHWTVPSYLDDETPPGGGLVFELMHDRASQARFVRVSFLTQTLDQIRGAETLTAANPPALAPITVPGCPQAPLCTQAEFAGLVRAAIDPTAVSLPDWRIGQ